MQRFCSQISNLLDICGFASKKNAKTCSFIFMNILGNVLEYNQLNLKSEDAYFWFCFQEMLHGSFLSRGKGIIKNVMNWDKKYVRVFLLLSC